MTAALKQYRELLGRVEELFSAIRNRHPKSFHCKQGCHSCCVPGITVGALEAASLREFLQENKLEAEAIALEQANPHQGTRCALLSQNGDCLAYNARPLVCRSHGAPLQLRPIGTKNENERVRDVCPLNFKETDVLKLPPGDVLNVDTLDTLLGLLTRLAFPGDETRTALRASALLKK